MQYEETRKILTILKTNYPQSFKDWNKEQSQMFLDMWAEAFKDDQVQLVVSAVKSIIYTDTREFAPNIAQVKEAMYKLQNQNEMTEQEAFALVRQACSNANYHAKEEFDKLPKVVQSIVGSPSQLRDWALMDSDTFNSVVSSNFMRSYKVRAKNEREFNKLPNEIKLMIGVMSNNLKLGNKDE